MPALFDFLNSINKKKVYYKDDEDLKGYSQWMINRFLMGEMNYTSVIGEINGAYEMTDRMHYDFLYRALPPNSKFFGYNMKKENKEQLIENVMKYFGVDLQRAKTYMGLISPEELEEIVEFYENRGIKGKAKKKKK